jgi:glycosyltransferase involved in cell wall biosynthesis
MKLVVITHTPHFKKEEALYAYGPYVKEMNLWTKYSDEVMIVAPVSKGETSPIHEEYTSNVIQLKEIPAISFVSFSETILALLKFPVLKWKIFQAMRKADHIHLRCPGTIGLIGCFVQILFPKKSKTAKYAGNWDPMAKQPLSYRLQKWILQNTSLTRNMQVLVYGDWPKQSKNVKPFFTASYPKSKIEAYQFKKIEIPFRFLFIGSLASGKRPLYAIELINALRNKGVDCQLDVYGEGLERDAMERYIQEQQLSNWVSLHGNQPAESVELAYKRSDLLLLPSRSEGWPKVVAEAMFWGVVPVVSKISCVPWMLDWGHRGILLDGELDKDSEHIFEQLQDVQTLKEMSRLGRNWSTQYTMDAFETAIKELLL